MPDPDVAGSKWSGFGRIARFWICCTPSLSLPCILRLEWLRLESVVWDACRHALVGVSLSFDWIVSFCLQVWLLYVEDGALYLPWIDGSLCEQDADVGPVREIDTMTFDENSRHRHTNAASYNTAAAGGRGALAAQGIHTLAHCAWLPSMHVEDFCGFANVPF